MLNKIINFTIALIISSAIIFLIFDWLIMPFYIRKGNSVIVMNLQGKNVDRALKELNAEGFKGEVFATLYTSKVDPGTVIDQYPVSGNRVKKGRTIRLKISQQEKMINVPNLVGQSRRSAEISLQQLGLNVDTIYTEYNPDYQRGTIAWQFPKFGDQIKKGYGLQLTVSMGLPPDFFQVPQLFGLSLNKAKDEISKSKLQLGKVSYQQDEDLVPYTVLDQSIIPGTVLDEPAKIDLIVSILDLQDIFDKLQNEK